MPTLVIVTSESTNSVLKYNLTTGAFVGVFASVDTVEPSGMVIGPDGKVYICKNGPLRAVVRYNADGTNFLVFAQDLIQMGPVLQGLCFDAAGKLYVANTGNNNVLRFNANGTFDTVFAWGNGLVAPGGLKIGNDGKLYVTSRGGNAGVLRFNANGTFDQKFLSVPDPLDLVQDSNSNWFVVDLTKRSVLKFNGAGSYLGLFATAGLGAPISLAIAPDASLLVANATFPPEGNDYPGSSVLKFDGTSGAFTSVFLSGGFLNGPQAIAFV